MLLAPWPDAVLAGILGLLVGSFLNVVIYRIPKMMERQWAAECAEYAATAGIVAPAAVQTEVFNLSQPRSRCQACGHQLRWYENIPVLSYVFLRGRCSSCGVGISARYPLVELFTAGCSSSAYSTGARRRRGWLGVSFPRCWSLWPSSTGTPPCCRTI